MKARKSNINTPTDHKPKTKMKPKGSISMTGPEKLLKASKKQIGAAKQTASSRIKHKKTVY